jgi:ubiquitin-protein ligase
VREGAYKDGIYKFEINIPSNYPSKPPEIIFMTKIYHPLVDFTTGKLDLSVIKILYRKNFNNGKLGKISSLKLFTLYKKYFIMIV